MHNEHRNPRSFLLQLAVAVALLAAAAATPAAAPADGRWTAPIEPFRIHGNTYYVGTKGLASVLVTSDFGHTLIDVGLPENAAKVAANIEKLGFEVADVKAILSTHPHADHAGGIPDIQARSNAAVYARRPANDVLRTGQVGRDDPQFGGGHPKMQPMRVVWVVHDGQTLGVGSNRFQAIATPGHTPGGTSWSWDACEGNGANCLRIVFADSLNAVSAPKFRFSDSKDYPNAVQDFESSFQRLESQRCDVLVSVHPEQSGFHERMANRVEGKPETVKDDGACKRYVDAARKALAERLATEGAARR